MVGNLSEQIFLIENRERFDLIYVDASHLALDVVVDASLSWQLLCGGGVVIFDDYRWSSPLGEDPFFCRVRRSTLS